VHEHDPLLGRGAQDRLILGHLDLDADRLEPDDMLVGHEPPRDCVLLSCDWAALNQGLYGKARCRKESREPGASLAGPAALLPGLCCWPG